MTYATLAVDYDCFPKNDSAKISGALDKFLKGASGGLGGAFDMVSGLNTAVSEISDAMSGFTTSMSTLLEDKLSEFVGTGLIAAKNFIFNKIANPIAALAQSEAFAGAAFKPISGLFGAFGCLGSTIKKALQGTIKNLLTNMVQKGFINPLECAVEDFIGSLTNKISSMMNSIIGPLVNPLNSLFSIVGKGFGSITGLLAGGINILGKVRGLLACTDSISSCHATKKYKLKVGSQKGDSKANKKNVIANAFNKGAEKFGSLGDKLDDKIKDWNNDPKAQRDEATCNTGNILECGLPRVEFFGGGGSGAVGDVILGNFIQQLDTQVKESPVGQVFESEGLSGSLIDDVQTTASIIGVDITYPGEGYTEEPIVSFVDNCDQGYGAYGRATIDKDPNSPTFGQLTGILMISEGEYYPTGEQSDVFVDKIEVENGGSGYNLNDKAGDFEICGVDENGSITKVCTNDKAYRTLPPANVESITGSGAILTPVMTRKRRQSEIITVIDCITPRGNIVGYVNGKVYNGPFHVMPNGDKMTGAVHNDNDAIIYNTPRESLRSGAAPTSNVGSTKVGLRSIQQLVSESESTETTTPQTTENTDLYSDPVDEATDTSGGSTPPSSPPSSGSSGGGYGY